MSETKELDWEDPTQAVALAANQDTETLLHNHYQRWVQPVYRYALVCLRNQADAEDVTSQTFMSVLKAGRPYLASPNFQSLLFRIVRNKVIDLVRKQNRQATVPLEEWVLPENPGPEWTREETLALKKSIASLPQTDQELLRLRYVAGLDHQTIAKILGKTSGSVRKALYRLVQRLKVEVGPHDA